MYVTVFVIDCKKKGKMFQIVSMYVQKISVAYGSQWTHNVFQKTNEMRMHKCIPVQYHFS